MELNNSNVELEAAEALLDRGVSLPLRFYKIPFSKRKIALRVVMRRPSWGSQIRISSHFLKLDISVEQMNNFTKDDELRFIARHGVRISKMVALTICRGYLVGYLFTPIMAWFLRNFTPRELILGANLRFVMLIGTKDFMPIIRSAQRINPMRPILSQQKKGS